MYLRNSISVRDLFWDSWLILAVAGVWAFAVDFWHDILGYKIFALPALPVTTFGVVVSLYLGFKTTSAYNRWWEARQIWGEIVNNSRTWANHTRNLIYTDGDADQEVVRRLILRHLAWVNALAYQLRKTSRLPVSQHQHIFDRRLAETGHLTTATPDCYTQYLVEDERRVLADVANPAVHIMAAQGDDLRILRRQGVLDDNRLVELMQVVSRLYDCQGKCERIKNTPFPRPITYFGRVFTWIFIILLPMAFIEAFEGILQLYHVEGVLAHEYMLVLIPFNMLISWVFFILEKVSDSCEDPFEGDPRTCRYQR